MIDYKNPIETETNIIAHNNGNCGNVIHTTDKSNGNCGNGPYTSEKIGFISMSSGKMNKVEGRQKSRKRKFYDAALFCFVLLIVMTLNTLISVMVSKSLYGSCPATVVFSCPSAWVGYEGRCYYFSESEETWDSSQSNCSASVASLVVIENEKEMNFIMQVKGPTEYWIGLKREEGQPWKWANGTVFNNWFAIGADGPCAYLNDEKATSTLCGIRRNWICSKSAHAA